MITIGIDPHKSLTAVAVDSTRESVDTMRITVTATTVRQLREWAARWPQRRWAVEGAEGLGRGVAQGLAGAGEQVVDVPAQLAARAWLLNSGHARKTDALDAASVAAVAAHHPGFARCAPRTTARVCGCCLTVATISPRNGPAPSTGCTPCCVTSSLAVRIGT
jgi:hypothetical protein